MNAAHIHLLLNHVPVLGAVFGLLQLSYGLLRDSDDVVKAGLGTLGLVGAAGIAVYLTGEPAEELIEGVRGVSEAALEQHEEAALRATWGGGLVGGVALIGLWIYRGTEVTRPFATVVLALTLALSGLMGWTANLGGKVHHPELRGPATATEAPSGPESGPGAEPGDGPGEESGEIEPVAGDG